MRYSTPLEEVKLGSLGLKGLSGVGNKGLYFSPKQCYWAIPSIFMCMRPSVDHCIARGSGVPLCRENPKGGSALTNAASLQSYNQWGSLSFEWDNTVIPRTAAAGILCRYVSNEKTTTLARVLSESQTPTVLIWIAYPTVSPSGLGNPL